MPARRMQRSMAFAAALCAGPAIAHHSIKMIEISSPVWLEATVVSYEPRNPHVLIHVVEKRADGSTNPVTVEGPIMRRLEDMRLPKDFIKPGDVLRMCGFPFKQDVLAYNAATPGLQKLPALHVHLLVLPNGRWQPWGPYGKLDNCIRPGDSPQRWVEFLDTVPMGLEYWCKGLAHSNVPSVAPQGFLDEVDRRIAMPCR